MKQIKGEDDYAGSDGEGSSSDEGKAPTKFIDSANQFGVKALKSKPSGDTGKVLDAEKVLKAARRVTGAVDIEDSDDESENLPPVHKAVMSKKDEKPSKKKVGFTTVEFGEDDLKNFNADKSKLIKEKDMEA